MYIALVLVCVDCSAILHRLVHEALEVEHIGFGDNLYGDLVALAFLGADDGCFLVLDAVHPELSSNTQGQVTGLASHPCFVYLDCTKERLSTIFIDFADTMAEMPRGLGLNAEVLHQLVAADTFRASGYEVNGYQPCGVAELACVHD